MAGQGQFPQQLSYDTTYYNPLSVNTQQDYFVPQQYTYQELQQPAQPLLTFYHNISQEISEREAKIKYIEAELLKEKTALKQREDERLKKQEEDERLRREEEEERNRKEEEERREKEAAEATAVALTAAAAAEAVRQGIEEARKREFAQHAALMPAYLNVESREAAAATATSSKALNMEELEEARQSRVKSRQERQSSLVANQDPYADVLSPSLLANSDDQTEDVVMDEEINIITLQQKYYLLQAQVGKLPDSYRRKYLEIKMGALTYKIHNLEKYHLKNLAKGNFDSDMIREEAERLFVKSLREKVFHHKKLISVPRPRHRK